MQKVGLSLKLHRYQGVFMQINIKPKSLGVWLNMKMLSLDVTDDALSTAINATTTTIASWKNDRNPPKLKFILRIVEHFSKVGDESPSDIMDELLDSMENYRRINKEYRVRQNAKLSTSTTNKDV